MSDPFCKLSRLLCGICRAPFHFACFIMNDSCHCKFLNAELPLLYISRMVRPGGRGRGGHPPPPPEYMARMMQQFDLNRQFMENIMA